MFASYLFRPEPRRCLIVGLGGGAMVLFLERFDPDLEIDAVEIDPVVVDVAAKFFGVTGGPRTRILTEDAFAYIGRTTERYDVIYMDAFLEPSAETDATGVPLRLKTIEFYRRLQGLLVPGGLVVFNLNRDVQTADDVATIREAFARVRPFPVPRKANLVVVGETEIEGPGEPELLVRAVRLDRTTDAGFSFEGLLSTMEADR